MTFTVVNPLIRVIYGSYDKFGEISFFMYHVLETLLYEFKKKSMAHLLLYYSM